MDTELQTLWALATGDFPVLPADEYEQVHLTYGPAFGPWSPVAVGGHHAAGTVLAVGGAVRDPVRALVAVAGDWRKLSDGPPGHPPVQSCPDEPTAGDVAGLAPHGLLVRRGLVRLSGRAPEPSIPAELPLLSGPPRSEPVT